MDRSEGARYDDALRVLSAAPAADEAAEMTRRYWLGVCRQRMGKPDAALADLDFVYRKNPNFEEVTYYLGRVYQQRHETDRALALTREYQEILNRRLELTEARTALRRDLGSPDLHLRVARAALAAGEPEVAVLECRAALRFRPGDAEAARLLEDSLQKSGHAHETRG
jgi:tetratricopeptide (TPR) repeat protein